MPRFFLAGQIPTPVPSTLGEWLLCLVVVLVILDKLKAIFWNSRKGDQYVDQAQFSELKETMANYVTRIELKRLEDNIATLTAEHKELSKYTHDRVHELASSINQVHVRIEVLHRELHRDIEQMSATITERIEAHAGKVAALAVLVDHVKELQANALTAREQASKRG